MNITDFFMTILVLMGFTILRFGIPLLTIWLVNLALSKLVPSSNKATSTPIS